MLACRVPTGRYLLLPARRNHDAWLAVSNILCCAQVYKWDPDREEKPSYKSYNIDINRCELAGLRAKPLSS